MLIFVLYAVFAGREGVISALAGDGEGHLIPLPVRRERPSRLSREDLEKEAETILRQAERINCIPSTGPGKFSTLPPRPKKKQGKRPFPTALSSIYVWAGSGQRIYHS